MRIGQDIPRVDGLAKLSGKAVYVDDLLLPGAWHGGTVRSPVARGAIRRIHMDPAINWREFAIIDHRDIPGRNEVRLIDLDQPVLAAGETRHLHEPILLIAHPSASRVREALAAIRVEADPLPAVLDPRDSGNPQHIQFGTDNVFKRIDIRKGCGSRPGEATRGEFEEIFRRAAHVVEGEYTTGAQEHIYLETQGMAAYREDGRMVLCGSMQCPYYVLDALVHAFGRPREAFRVVQTPLGGGFGGKEDFPSQLAIHTALLSERANAPVKIIYDRQEDMAATTKRHPSSVRHRTAVDADGRLLAMEVSVLMDGGAYVTLSPVVLSRGCIHAAGPYACEHAYVHGEARLTNSPPYGAFRGFGAPQTQFAMEVHMDAIARRVGLDPVELRRRNLLRSGQATVTGQAVSDADPLDLLDQAARRFDYAGRGPADEQFNRGHPYLRRGAGAAAFFHGSGFTGSGEVQLASEVWVDARPDGTIEVLTAQTDMGQGTTTILAQIAADRLGLPADRVHVAQPDTTRVPNSGPTVASRTAMVVGGLVVQACDDLRRQLAGSSPSALVADDLVRAILAWHAGQAGGRLRGHARYQRPAGLTWDDRDYRGDAYADYSWGVNLAAVEVDLRTYQVRVTDFVAGQEVGRVINPTLAAGQVQGGVAQSIGWALYEDVVLENGAMKNAQLTNYILPTSADLPPLRVFFTEHPSRHGPGGARGLGEIPVDGPAAAVVNAVSRALGRSFTAIPLTPERLMEGLEGTT